MDELKQKKEIGIRHLQNNEFKEAVNVYKEILIEYPDDIESYLLLGDLYLAKEDYPAAEKIYEKALTLDPDNLIIQRRIKLCTQELSSSIDNEIPTDAESVMKLLQTISGRTSPVTDNDLHNAATLLDEIVHSDNPAEIVSKKLDQIDNLLPALIELNIRQARFDRRYDLVTLLQALKDEISYLKIESEKNVTKGINTSSQHQTKLKEVLLLVPDEENVSERMLGFKEYLVGQGVSVKKITDPDPSPDLVLCSNPHIQTEHIEILANFSAQHIPIVVDLDDDFEFMPINHPDYAIAGLGSLEKSRSYTAALVFANLITVPGETMANRIKEYGYNVAVVPFGWSSKNEQWLKHPAQRSTINIGIIGIQGSYENVQKYKRIIIRVLREFPQTRIVVCGDPISYKLFENISESRRLFLPQVPEQDMPYILNQMDILLVPLNITPYHLSTSDKILMQAGLKAIPWISSPIPDFIKWQSGGVATETLEEWHSYMRQFIQDKELRNTLGQAGKNRAIQREETLIFSGWFKKISQLIN